MSDTNKLIIDDIEIINNTINYKFEVYGQWAECFKKNSFSVSYSCDVSAVPKSIAIIPLLTNILPVAWIYDAEITAPCCDEAFYNSISMFKQGYIEMYPMIDFCGKLTVTKIEHNSNLKSGNCAAFFSGGVDAFNTLVNHYDEKPTLLTLCGADIRLDDHEGWLKVEAHTKNTAKLFDTDYITIKSGFRTFLNEGLLHSVVYQKCHDGWWHGFQHGIGLIGHAAPLAYIYGYDIVYIASSYTINDKGKFSCASDPTIDNYVRFGDSQTIHDGYEFDRQSKVHNITSFSDNQKINISLRVCWESDGGSNCCNCEKCWRTIMSIYSDGYDPKEFGFDYSSLSEVGRLMYRNQEKLLVHRDVFYLPIQKSLHENYSIKTVEPDLRWFYRIDINKLGKVGLPKKLYRKIKNRIGAFFKALGV